MQKYSILNIKGREIIVRKHSAVIQEQQRTPHPTFQGHLYLLE